MRVKRFLACLMALLLAIALVPALKQAAAAPGDAGVYMVEIYGGGGSGTTNSYCQYDYVILFNNTEQAVLLDGWSLQYMTAGQSGPTNSAANIATLSGTIEAKSYFLVQGAGTANTSREFPIDPDCITSLALPTGSASSNYKLALVTNSTPLTGLSVPNIASSTVIADFVGLEGASPLLYLGAGPVPYGTPNPTLTGTRCLTRNSSFAGNNNLEWSVTTTAGDFRILNTLGGGSTAPSKAVVGWTFGTVNDPEIASSDPSLSQEMNLNRLVHFDGLLTGRFYNHGSQTIGGVTTNKRAYGAVGWDWEEDVADDGKAFYFSFYTTGYKKLTISFQAASSNTGPKYLQAQAKIGGVWEDVPGAALTLEAGGSWKTLNATAINLPVWDLPAGTLLEMRIVRIGSDACARAEIAPGGSCQIDDLLIEGVKMGSGETLAPAPAIVTADPPPSAGTIAARDYITLTCATPLATIFYKAGSANYVEVASGTSVPVYNGMPITAYAALDGAYNGPSSVFQYTIDNTADELGARVGTGPVVIEEIYGKGGNVGALYTEDYIVLRNISDTTVDIGDWSLLFATQNQPFTTTQAPTRCFTFAPGTEIRPGGYFLVICSQGVSQMGAYWLPGGDVFAVNYTEDGDKWLTLSAAGGKLALVMNSDECTGADDPNLVDMVCWGSPSDYLGNGPAVGTPKVLDTLARVKDMDDDGALSMAELFGGSYTGDNIRDFETAWPNPRDSFSAATETEYVAPVTAPQSRTLLAGTPVILECETENAIIFYSLDGAPYEEYTGPIDSTGLLQTRIMAFAIAVVGGNTIYGDPSLFGFVFLAPDGNYTISQARTLLDQEVEVTGVVTFMETNAAGTSVTFTMQDETGGITVRGSAYEFRNVSPGKTVKVKGMRASYRGLEQIVNAQLRNTPVLTGMPAPIVATAADLNDYEFAETHESMYVVLEIARMDEIKYEGGFGGTPPATGIIDGTGVINIHYIPTITEIQKGDIVEVRAVLTQNAQDLIAFLDGYFLRIMDESWITLIERPLVSEEEWTIAAWDQGTGSGTPQMLASGGEYGWMSVVRNADTDDEVYNITTSKSSMVAKNWNQPGRYLQFSISTKGFKEIMLSAKLRVSAAGPRNFKMEYSLDGVTFLPVPDSNFSVAHNKVNDTLMQRLYRFALPVELENQDTVILRWMLADNMRGDGSNGKISGAGALNFTGVHFTGIPVEDLPIVIATPPAGEVPLGQSVGLTSDPVGADIYYRRYIAPVYGEEEEEGPLVDENPEPWTLYTGTPVTLPDLPYTLQAYAEIVGSPTLTGRIFNFEYVQARCAPVKSTAYTGSLREDQQVTLSTATSGATLMVTITTRHGLSGQLTMNYSGVDIYNMSFGAGLFPVHVEVYANKSGYLDSEILVLDYTLRESGGEQFYFGQIHSHTTLSDGAGSIEDAYNYAYHAQNVDFLFITDHSHYLDTPGNLGTMDGKKLGTVIPSPLGGTTTKWEYAKSVADNYTDGTFVADFGYEMTWSGQYGHINTYATEGFVSRNNGLYTTSGGAGLRTYYDTLAQYPQSISMFNHPGSTFGTFDDYAYYTEEYDAQMHLIEVGNGEGRIPSGGYWRSYEQYTRALDKGWHLAPANNQDNHKGRWGDANTGRTVVWTNEFSRNGVLQAMRELCVYATEDHNLEITYFINGEPMGTIFEFKPEYLNFKVTVYDPDIKDKDFTMSVITSNGAVAYSAPGVISGSSAKEFTFTLQPDQAYYYIRIDQADGDIAVTAPIWVGEVMKVSVDLKADTNTPVVGKSMQLTATISNSEQLPFVVSRVEYFADNSSFGVNTPTLSVPAAGTRTDSISYTPTAAGRLSLRVEVTGTVDGAPVTVSGLLELNVLLPTDVLHIALDASHSNMYVNGNQADRYDQLELIAKEFNADVRLIEGGITDVKLADVGLLILTAPYFSWNNVGSAYTSAELAAIVNYANKGGNIAVMGKADRGDGATKANARLNAVLSELGAKASLHAATAIDTQYAQNMTSYDFILPDVSHYDLSSRFLADVQAESSWALEYYAGSTVQPNGAQVLVHGGEYTVSTAFDNLSTTAPYLPIGGTPVVSGTGAALVTAETLSGGGYLLVSGFAFFNDWQIPAIDVIGETRNVNYFMTRNMIMAAVKTTPIGEVRPAAEGRWFAIEGIVTSNGSDFDVNTAFFDSIYVQDETGGINLFPVSGDFELGEKVWACGFLGEYQGDRQLSDVQIYHYGEGLEPKEPIYKTTQQSMYEGNQGWLVKVEGVVTEVLYNEGVVEYIFIDDGSGITRVFIDGYIYCDEPGCDKSGPGHDFGWVVVGAKIRAVGIASTGMHPDGEGVDQLLPRIRVRNRREVEPIDSFTPQLPDGNPFVWGDADLSGVCTAADAAAVLRYLAGLSDLSGQGYINGNVIADDDLNAADAALILRYLAGLYVIPTTT